MNKLPGTEITILDGLMPMLVPKEGIIPDTKNPRVTKKLTLLVDGMRRFGVRWPIVVNQRTKIIEAGHQRFAAMLELGATQVPVLWADDDGKTSQAFNIADNKIGESVAEWDEDALHALLQELSDGDSLQGLGYEDSELMDMLAKEGVGEEEAEVDVSESAADVAQQKWGTALGQVWQLGSHRIMCGDSTNNDNVNILLKEEKPHLMVTDPPYGVEYDADWRNHALREDGTPIAGRATGKVENDDIADWTEAWRLFPGDVVYVWHAGCKTSIVQSSLESVGFIMRAQIIWSKNVFAIGRGDYHWKHEPCWYAVRKGKTGHFCDDRTQTTVWDIDKPSK